MIYWNFRGRISWIDFSVNFFFNFSTWNSRTFEKHSWNDQTSSNNLHFAIFSLSNEKSKVELMWLAWLNSHLFDCGASISHFPPPTWNFPPPKIRIKTPQSYIYIRLNEEIYWIKGWIENQPTSQRKSVKN